MSFCFSLVRLSAVNKRCSKFGSLFREMMISSVHCFVGLSIKLRSASFMRSAECHFSSCLCSWCMPKMFAWFILHLFVFFSKFESWSEVRVSNLTITSHLTHLVFQCRAWLMQFCQCTKQDASSSWHLKGNLEKKCLERNLGEEMTKRTLWDMNTNQTCSQCLSSVNTYVFIQNK